VRTFDTLTDFYCIKEHIPDMINPSDQVARSGWSSSTDLFRYVGGW
jgi:hypothetical protein